MRLHFPFRYSERGLARVDSTILRSRTQGVCCWDERYRHKHTYSFGGSRQKKTSFAHVTPCWVVLILHHISENIHKYLFFLISSKYIFNDLSQTNKILEWRHWAVKYILNRLTWQKKKNNFFLYIKTNNGFLEELYYTSL